MMVDRKYLEELGLDEDQIARLMDRLNKESRFRQLLGQAGVTNVELISIATDIREVDFSNERLLKEKILIEFGDMIPKAKKNVQIWA